LALLLSMVPLIFKTCCLPHPQWYWPRTGRSEDGKGQQLYSGTSKPCKISHQPMQPSTMHSSMLLARKS